MRYIILLLLIVSCGANKKTSTTYVKEVDSISYVLPSDNTLVISNLCDSIKSPVQVLKTISNGVSKTKLEIKGNTLTIETKTDTIFKDKIRYVDKSIVETKEVPYTPKWVKTLLYILIITVFVFIAFPFIPKFINGSLRKIVGL